MGHFVKSLEVSPNSVTAAVLNLFLLSAGAADRSWILL